MHFGKIGITLLGTLAAINLMSCNALSPEGRQPQESEQQASHQSGIAKTYSGFGRAGGKVVVLDPTTSVIRMYAFRAGRAARFGHNHVLSAPQFIGYVYLPSGGMDDARFDLEFRLDQLEIDNPTHRAKLGSSFDSKLTATDIEGTRDHMLGERNLQADVFPFVRIHSVQVSGELPKLAAKIEVELHGQKREMWVPLTVEGLPDRFSVSGALVLRQTDFGVQPYSALGGLLAVQDEVIVEFTLAGT